MEAGPNPVTISHCLWPHPSAQHSVGHLQQGLKEVLSACAILWQPPTPVTFSCPLWQVQHAAGHVQESLHPVVSACVTSWQPHPSGHLQQGLKEVLPACAIPWQPPTSVTSSCSLCYTQHAAGHVQEGLQPVFSSCAIPWQPHSVGHFQQGLKEVLSICAIPRQPPTSVILWQPPKSVTASSLSECHQQSSGHLQERPQQDQAACATPCQPPRPVTTACPLRPQPQAQQPGGHLQEGHPLVLLPCVISWFFSNSVTSSTHTLLGSTSNNPSYKPNPSPPGATSPGSVRAGLKSAASGSSSPPPSPAPDHLSSSDGPGNPCPDLCQHLEGSSVHRRGQDILPVLSWCPLDPPVRPLLSVRPGIPIPDLSQLLAGAHDRQEGPPLMGSQVPPRAHQHGPSGPQDQSQHGPLQPRGLAVKLAIPSQEPGESKTRRVLLSEGTPPPSDGRSLQPSFTRAGPPPPHPAIKPRGGTRRESRPHREHPSSHGLGALLPSIKLQDRLRQSPRPRRNHTSSSSLGAPQPSTRQQGRPRHSPRLNRNHSSSLGLSAPQPSSRQQGGSRHPTRPCWNHSASGPPPTTTGSLPLPLAGVHSRQQGQQHHPLIKQFNSQPWFPPSLSQTSTSPHIPSWHFNNGSPTSSLPSHPIGLLNPLHLHFYLLNKGLLSGLIQVKKWRQECVNRQDESVKMNSSVCANRSVNQLLNKDLKILVSPVSSPHANTSFGVSFNDVKMNIARGTKWTERSTFLQGKTRREKSPLTLPAFPPQVQSPEVPQESGSALLTTGVVPCKFSWSYSHRQSGLEILPRFNVQHRGGLEPLARFNVQHSGYPSHRRSGQLLVLCTCSPCHSS